MTGIAISGMSGVLETTARGMKPDYIAKELYEVGTDVFRESQVNVPSDSGDLHASGRVVNRGTKRASSTITYGSAGVDYAAYVHYGTGAQASQPYLANAFYDVAPTLGQRLNEAARKGLGQ
jgi:hypothetical protein